MQAPTLISVSIDVIVRWWKLHHLSGISVEEITWLLLTQNNIFIQIKSKIFFFNRLVKNIFYFEYSYVQTRHPARGSKWLPTLQMGGGGIGNQLLTFDLLKSQSPFTVGGGGGRDWEPTCKFWCWVQVC